MNGDRRTKYFIDERLLSSQRTARIFRNKLLSGRVKLTGCTRHTQISRSKRSVNDVDAYAATTTITTRLQYKRYCSRRRFESERSLARVGVCRPLRSAGDIRVLTVRAGTVVVSSAVGMRAQTDVQLTRRRARTAAVDVRRTAVAVLFAVGRSAGLRVVQPTLVFFFGHRRTGIVHKTQARIRLSPCSRIDWPEPPALAVQSSHGTENLAGARPNREPETKIPSADQTRVVFRFLKTGIIKNKGRRG